MTTLIIPVELNENSLNDYDLPKEFINEITIMLKHFDEFCDRHNLYYWIDGGTMLGAIRDRNHILYDNDADVGIFQDDFDKFIINKNELESYGYVIKEEIDGFMKIFSRNVAIEEHDGTITSPCLDVIVYKQFKKIIVISNDGFRRKFPQCYHMVNDFYPLIRVQYGEIALPCVFNPIPYLDRQYPEWQKKRIYDHKIYNLSDEQIEQFRQDLDKF
jgi:phosphorylcholine metabolism protein LicD